MSKVEIKVPSVGESVTEVTLSTWLKQDGDFVKIDEPLCELESEKATFELPSEVAGQLQIVAQAGSDLKIGDVVCIIDTSQTATETNEQTVFKEVAKVEEKQPEVKVRGISRDDMKVEIAVWTLGITYEDTQFFLYEELHRAFEAEGIVLAKERRKESV